MSSRFKSTLLSIPITTTTLPEGSRRYGEQTLWLKMAYSQQVNADVRLVYFGSGAYTATHLSL
jgi:hypothetical protein